MRKFLIAALALLASTCASAQYATLTGTLQSSNGLVASNYTISFKPSQLGFIAGTGVLVNTTTTCATSTDGSVVGLGNPLASSIVTAAFAGTLPAGNYYVEYAWQGPGGTITLASPETVVNLAGTGNLLIPLPPGGAPAGVTVMNVYIGTTSGAETLQGSTSVLATYNQNVPLVTGAALPAANTTVCKQVANDAIWPVGTGYTVALIDANGNSQPGYPMMWQLLGPNTTINLSNGLPYYHGVVTFPVPILASPLNHALQSISGDLGLGGYYLRNAGAVGVGTNLPAYSVDVENGLINSSGGFLLNGTGGTRGQCLGSDGTAFNMAFNCTTAPNPNIPHLVFTSPAAGTLITGSNDGAGFITLSNGGTGSGAVVFQLVFGGTYLNPMYCVISTSASGASFFLNSTPSTTSFTVIDNGAPATPNISYLCHQ